MPWSILSSCSLARSTALSFRPPLPLNLSRNPMALSSRVAVGAVPRCFGQYCETALMSPADRVVVVVGPTGSGKSNLAVALAQRLGDAEVLNADSMQLYRGMDVGTAKASPDERGGVPHHLLDVLDVTEPGSVAEFQLMARDMVADCVSRGVTPIVVGGSALYVRAVIDPLDFPDRKSTRL